MTSSGWMRGALCALLVVGTIGCGSTRNTSPVKKVSGVDTRAPGVSPQVQQPAGGNVAPPQQQVYAPPPQQQPVYNPPPQQPVYNPPPQQPVYNPPPQQPVYTPPPQQQPVYAPPPQQPAGGGSGATWVEYPSLQGDVLAFIQEVGPRAGARTIGCLPFYSRDPTNFERPSYPSLLGERVADQIAQSLPNYGYRGTSLPLGPGMMAMRVASANVPRDGLGEVAGISQHGRKFGVDIIVFGEFVRTGNEVRGDMYAWDLSGNAPIAQRTLIFGAGGREAAHFLQPSPWDPGSGMGTADTAGSFTNELRALTGTLARLIVEQGRLPNFQGSVYVAPADTSSFIGEISELRSAQRIFGLEWAKRHQKSIETGEPMDEATPPPPVGNRRFESLTELQYFVVQQRERLMASPAARLCVQLSRWLVEGMQVQLNDTPAVIQDLGFTRPSDTQLVEGELASGGLTNSLQARTKMLEQGITVAVQLFLERWGDEFTLRVEVYDLQQNRTIATQSQDIQPQWRDAMNQELGF